MFFCPAPFVNTPAAGTGFFKADLTIASGTVDSDLTDFPVYVDLSDMPGEFWGHVAADGGDIRVKTTGGTLIPFDLVNFDQGAETGVLFFKHTLVSASDNTVEIHYGDSSLELLPVDDSNGRNAVWSDYNAVFLMHGDWTDRTGGTGGTPTGTISFSPITNGAGGGAVIDSGEYVTAGGRADYDVFTLGITCTWSNKSQTRAPLSYWEDGADNVRATLAYRSTSTEIGFWDVGNSWTFASPTINPTLDQAYRLHGVWNGATYKRLFVDGALAGEDTTVGAPGAGADYNTILIGREDASSSELHAGRVGFVYLRGAALSTDWIAAEYANISAPGTFYTIGPEEEV